VSAAYGFATLSWPAHLAVLAFFFLSGYVLALTYDGRPIQFMARRIIRLWPLYACCLAAGCAIRGERLPYHILFWFPFPAIGTLPPGDPPAWSLYYEIWATPGIILLTMMARKIRIAALSLALGSVALFPLDLRLGYVPFFALGVALSAFTIRLPGKAPKFLLWLGKLSYSIYLTHLPVRFAAENLLGPPGSALSLLAMPFVAYGAWRWIERPSIIWSRRLTDFRFVGSRDAAREIHRAWRRGDDPLVAEQRSEAQP